MSSIDFGVDHRFFPAGRRPDELGVGFLVVNPKSPKDFIRLSKAPESVKTETLNPKEGLSSSKKNALNAHIQSFLELHYSIDVKNSGQVSGVKLITERINNVSSSLLKTMLSEPDAIAFLKRVAEERAQRSKVKSWAAIFFNLDPWLVTSTHTFYDSSVNVTSAETTSVSVDVTAPITEALTSSPVGAGDPGAGMSCKKGREANKKGKSVQPLVFAAKFQQIRYKLRDDQLASCYLLEDKSVPLGFFGENEGGPRAKDPIQTVDDMVAAITSGAIDVEFEIDESCGFDEFLEADDSMVLDGVTYVAGI